MLPRLAVAALVAALGPLAAGCKIIVRSEPEGPSQDGQSAPPPSSGGGAPRRDEPRPGELRLDPRWAPLEAIVERAALPGLSNTAATTIGTKVHVVDLAAWLKRHPEGSPRFDAVLHHEQVHARRQLAAGVDPWIARYLRDRAFMWAEEQRGWYEELRHLQARGLQVNPPGVAKVLSKYSNLAGPMVTYDEALAWVQAVLAGTWRPAD